MNHCHLCIKVCSLTYPNTDRTVLQNKPEQQGKLLQLASEMVYMKTQVISKGEIFFLTSFLSAQSTPKAKFYLLTSQVIK